MPPPARNFCGFAVLYSVEGAGRGERRNAMAHMSSGASRDGGAVELVRDRVDIVNLVSETVPLRKRGRAFVANGPFNTEKTPSFHVNPERQSWRCFGACAEGG